MRDSCPLLKVAGRALAILLVLAGRLVAVDGGTDVSATYAQAESLVRQEQWTEGIALLNQVLKAEPGNLKALNLMGIALTEEGEISAANAEFKHALRINAHFAPALKNLAINELSQKNIDDAHRHLLAALEIVPNDQVANAYVGNIAYSRHEYRAAVSHLEKAGDPLRDPSLASRLIESYLEIGRQHEALVLLSKLDQGDISLKLQFRLGLALAGHELYSQAIPYFQAVNAKYPESHDSAFNLAVCYIETKQFTGAIEVLRRAADAGVGSQAGAQAKTAELDNLLAEAYEGNHLTQAAIDALHEATKLAPEEESNYLDLAALCTSYEAYDLGLEVIEVGLHYHPGSDRLIFQRGVIYAMQNRFDLAERDFQLAAGLAPEKNLSYIALGVTHMQTGNLPKAIAELRRRAQRAPGDATLQYLLGDALIRSGATLGDRAFTDAKAALETSVKKNNQFAPAQIDLAKLYLKENRLDDAVRHLERAQSLDPKEKGAYSQLAVVYRRKGDPEKASAMLAALNKLNDDERQAQGHRVRLHAVQEAPLNAAP